MSKYTKKSFDMCVIAAQDNSFAVCATGAAAASAVATAAHDSTNIIYITGFSVTTTPGTAVVSGAVTLAGLATGGNANASATLTYEFSENTTQGGRLDVQFVNPLPAADSATDVVLTVPALTNGGAVSAILFGYARPE